MEVKFLAGAPLSHSLDFSANVLCNDFIEPFSRYLGLGHDLGNDAVAVAPAATAQVPAAKWRAVNLNDRTFYESPVVRRQLKGKTAPLLASSPRDDEDEEDADDDNDFIEHSFAIHANIQSSQLAPSPSPRDEDESTFITESSFTSTTLLDRSTALQAHPAPVLPRQPHRLPPQIRDLNTIPSAPTLRRLQPQTLTVNLVVAIIAVAPPRRVHVRRGTGYDMDIIELLVGDDTRAGFSISSWHSPSSPSSASASSADEIGGDNSDSPAAAAAAADPIRSALRALRPRDVVLIERVALSSFNGSVFGQSLNARATKNTTRVSVLARCQGLGRGEGGGVLAAGLSESVAAKLERVVRWADDFVGVGGGDGGGPRGVERAARRDQGEFLPPDSQV